MGTGDEQAAGGTAGTTDDVCAPLPGWYAEEREHRRNERRFWNAYIGLTVPIVIGAVLSAFFAYRAYDTTLQALVEAKRQANAAEAQIDVARDTEHRQLRAYLHINHGPMTVSENTASAEVRISHSGQTPAYKIILEADIQVGHFPCQAPKSSACRPGEYRNTSSGHFTVTSPSNRRSPCRKTQMMRSKFRSEAATGSRADCRSFTYSDA